MFQGAAVRRPGKLSLTGLGNGRHSGESRTAAASLLLSLNWPSRKSADGRALPAVSGSYLDAQVRRPLCGVELREATGCWRPISDSRFPELAAVKPPLARRTYSLPRFARSRRFDPIRRQDELHRRRRTVMRVSPEARHRAEGDGACGNPARPSPPVSQAGTSVGGPRPRQRRRCGME